MKKLLSLFLCLVLLVGLLPLAAPARAATVLAVSSVKADKTSSGVGATITWTASASGGTGTLRYYFNLYKDGTKLTARSYSTANTFSYTPEEAGSYKVRVYVKDADGTKVNKLSAAVTVAPLTLSSVNADKTSAGVGATITWTAAASGGTGTLRYYFNVYKDGTKIKTRSYSTKNTFSYTPEEAGTYKARVYVKDADGTKVSKLSTGVTVSEGTREYALVTYVFIAHDHSWGGPDEYYAQAIMDDGEIVKLPISQTTYASLTVGKVYKLTVSGTQYILTAPGTDVCSSEAYNASDPQTDYSGAVWIWHNGKTAANLQSIVCKAKPQNGSNVNIVYRKEKTGTSYVRKVKAVWFQTPATAMPAIKSIKADKTSVNVGETVTWTATASGGDGTLKYYFNVYKDGTKVASRAYNTANTFSYTPAEAGSYKVRVYVKDAVDLKANKLSSGVTVSEDTGEYALVTYIFIAYDEWHVETYYAQAIMDDGAIVRLPISQATYDSLTVGKVYRLVLAGSLYEFRTPGADECSSEAYNASDPQTDYTGAVWIGHNGKTAADLAVKLSTKPKAGSNVIIVYTTEQTIRKVKAVWFQTAG